MFSKSTLTATVVAAGLALFASSPAWAQATTTYASPTGSDTADCSDPAQPCGLQRAIVQAPPGGEVVLAPGTYTSGVTIDVPWQLNVHGQAGEPRPTIANDHSSCGHDDFCRTSPAVVLSSPQGSFSHVHVVEYGGYSGTAALTIDNPADAQRETVEDVIAEGDDGIGIATEGDALIRDTVAWAPNTPATAAIYATQSFAPGTVHLSLENVTAVASGNAFGLKVYGGCTAPQTCDVQVQMENSILKGGASDVSLGGYGNVGFYVDASHSNYRSGNGYITPEGTNGNQTAEPQFVDPAHGDFHQLATSPTIDAGVASANLGPADIDGDSRSLGSAPDIGADEWVPATQPAQPQQPQQPPVQPAQPPAQPQQPGSGSGGGRHSRVAKAFRGVHVRGGRLRLRHGKLRVRVSCPRQARHYCKGTLTLKAAHHSGRAGHASFKLKPGRSKFVSVTVRRKLRKVRRFSVTARAHDAAGHSFATHARVRVKRG